jgi:hypothetical protein
LSAIVEAAQEITSVIEEAAVPEPRSAARDMLRVLWNAAWKRPIILLRPMRRFHLPQTKLWIYHPDVDVRNLDIVAAPASWPYNPDLLTLQMGPDNHQQHNKKSTWTSNKIRQP